MTKIVLFSLKEKQKEVGEEQIECEGEWEYPGMARKRMHRHQGSCNVVNHQGQSTTERGCF